MKHFALLLSWMFVLLVCPEGLCVLVALGALLTHKSTLHRVRALVGLPLLGVPKGPGAHGAGVGLLACVDPAVDQQFVLLAEGGAAVRALEPPGVECGVPGHLLRSLDDLLALVAGVGGGIGDGLLQHHVLGLEVLPPLVEGKELVSALLAGVGLLACVNPLVARQTQSGHEGHGAITAHVLSFLLVICS